MNDNWVCIGYTHDTGMERKADERVRCGCWIWCPRRATQEDLLCDRCRTQCPADERWMA